MDYTNETAGLPPTDIPMGGFLNGMNTSIRQETMLPFLRNNNIQSDVATQQAQQKQMEFMSPAAQEMRRQAIAQETQKSATEAQNLPLRAQQERMDLQNKAQLNPDQQATAMEEAKQKKIKALGTPTADFLSDTAAALKDVPAPLRGQAYLAHIDAFKQTHPGFEPDPKLATFSPHVMNLATSVMNARTNTPEYTQKQAESTKEQAAALARTKVTAGATMGAEGMRAASAERMNAATLEAANLPKQIYSLKQKLSDPKLTASQRSAAGEQLYGYVAKEADDLATKDIGIINLGISVMNPETRNDALKQMDSRKSGILLERLIHNGLIPKMSDIRSAYPGVAEDKLKEGFKKKYGVDIK